MTPAGSPRQDEPEVLRIRAYEDADEDAVVDLWERCELTRSWNDPRKDIARKQNVRPDLFFVGVVRGQIVATVMAGYDGHRGWINYLAVAPACRREGLGRAMMARAEEMLRETGCPKINLQVRVGNDAAMEFYRRVGYLDDAVVSLGKRLVPDVDDRADDAREA